MKKFSAKKIIFAGLLVAVFLLAPSGLTHAQTTTGGTIASFAANTTISFISWTLGTILFVIGYFFHLVLFLGGTILNWVLELNSNIIDNPAVQIGWPITRDIANLAFVFLIILIAFETILNTGALQIKKALPKLIIAALLINFSLLIATVVLDFAGIFTNFFLNSAYSASGNGGISQALAGAMNMYAFLKTPTFDANVTLTTFGAGTVQFLSSLIFADIMTAVGAITMLGLAAMFLIRYVVIGILLITLPAAIIGWVVGGSGWSEWTKKFFKQTFFGPIAAFYIYIALKSYTAIQGIVKSSSITKAVADDPSHVIQNTATDIGSMIMIVSILLYGIKKAEEGSEYTGKWTTNAATGAMKFIGKVAASPFTLGSKGVSTAGLMGGAAISEKLGLSRIGRGTRYEGLLRPLRKIGASAEEAKKNYGGLKDIPSAVFEEVTGGYGAANRKFRLKEQGQFKSEDKEVERLSKKMVYFDPNQAGNAGYMDQYNKDIAKAQADIKEYLNKNSGSLEKTTKEFEKRSTIKSLAKRADVNEKTVSDFIENNAGDIENAKKYFEREGDIKGLMKSTLATRQQVEDALKKNFNNLKDARNELNKPATRKQNEERIAKEKQEQKEGAHEDYMEHGFPRT